MKTVGDPLTKGGIIGAFCQVHGIQDAIEKFLPEVYTACDVADRYTFNGGSTSAGLVVYQDKWAYSHHSTDPCSEKLVNAFDLVRLHTYGDLDKDDDGDTPLNRRPSQLAMLDLAVQEEAVKIIVTAEKLTKTRYDFSAAESFRENLEEDEAVGDGLDDIEEPEYDGPDETDMGDTGTVMLKDLEWVGKMDLDRRGNPHNTIDNILVILRNDVRLKGKFIYNAFTNRQIVTGNLPWRKVKKSANLFTDGDDSGLRCYLESMYKITIASKIQDALIINFLDNSFHPVRDYIRGLAWDGIPRLDTLLIDYLAAEDNEYTRMVTRKTIVAAVTRVFRPGIKYETVLTLVGKQGLGKSTLLRKLSQPWFSDNLRTFHGKDAIEMLQGVWIVELGELSAMKKADVETIKSFVSIQVDRMRVAYGRRVDDFPRQCIFIASTNDTQPLKDQTGNRRFWPVKCDLHKPAKSVFRDFDTTTQQQILAEAYQFFLKGEPVYLNPRMERWALQVQDAYRETDDRAGQVWEFLNLKLPENWDDIPTIQRISFIKTGTIQTDIGEKEITVSENRVERTRVCAAEIWNELFNGFGIDMTPHNTKFIHDILKNTEGWEPYEKVKEVFNFYGIQRSYHRVEMRGN
jgi:predicted P-loop ATPase